MLARLSVPEDLKATAPRCAPKESFYVITTNTDRLSRAALDAFKRRKLYAYNPRMSSLVEMHGNIFVVSCTACDYSAENRSNPLVPALGPHEDDDNGADYWLSRQISEKDLPRCPECGALARPGVVWPEETSPRLQEINKLVAKADLIVVVGTSLGVSLLNNSRFSCSVFLAVTSSVTLCGSQTKTKVQDRCFYLEAIRE